MDQPGETAVEKCLQAESSSTLPIYILSPFRCVKAKVPKGFLLLTGKVLLIYPAPGIRLRVTCAKPEKDYRGSLNVREMEDDCSIEYGFYKVVRHSI